MKKRSILCLFMVVIMAFTVGCANVPENLEVQEAATEMPVEEETISQKVWDGSEIIVTSSEFMEILSEELSEEYSEEEDGSYSIGKGNVIFSNSNGEIISDGEQIDAIIVMMLDFTHKNKSLMMKIVEMFEPSMSEDDMAKDVFYSELIALDMANEESIILNGVEYMYLEMGDLGETFSIWT